jgi:hypothetical protein
MDYSEEERDLIAGAAMILYPTANYAQFFTTLGKPFFPSLETCLYADEKIKQTTLKIGCIPFGGYVALPQLDPTGMSALQGNPDASGAAERRLPAVQPWKKMLVSVSGAAGNAVTLYGGYRGGGGFTAQATGQALDLESSGTVSASLDFAMDASRQYQLFVSYQDSKIPNFTGSGGASASGQSLPMSVTYLHVGGTNFFDGPIGKGPYVVGGFGATLFQPSMSGYSSEWRPSMNIGIGYQWPLGESLALRVEARGYLTLINSESSLFCSGGCVVNIKGDAFTQGEALIGLSARF